MRVLSKCISASLLLAGFLFLSCASGKVGVIDPARAVYQLAPVARAAVKPSEGVYYCIFVRSFADSNGDGIGDLKGLTAKLDYLNDGNDKTTTDLGITGIWLMPIFTSQSYHGYDVDDYFKIQSDYGTMDDFKVFMSEAHKRGISVILDLTTNHSSVYTDWFIDSKKPDSPYRNWYRWIKADDPRYNVNQKIWGHNVWNKVGDSYYAGLFGSNMPDFNLANLEVRTEFKKIAKFWMDKGVDGFRLDAAGHVFNAAKLAIGEPSEPQAIDWWKEFVGYCKTVDTLAYTVGEVWEQPSIRADYMKGLGSTFHFDMGTKIVDAIRTGDGGQNNLANSFYADYQTYAAANPDYIDAPFLTNHDQNRISGMLRGDPAELKLAASIYMLSEGVPFIYYGEEIGLMGAKPDEQIRTPMLWNLPGRDKMQTTWVESRYNKNTIPVALQEKNKDSVLQFYKRLVRVKTAHPALYSGRMKPLFTGNSALDSWTLESATEKAFVVLNLSDAAVTVTLPAEYTAFSGTTPMTLVFATYDGTKISAGNTLSIAPRGTAVLAGYK